MPAQAFDSRRDTQPRARPGEGAIQRPGQYSTLMRDALGHLYEFVGGIQWPIIYFTKQFTPKNTLQFLVGVHFTFNTI